eukprot:TRINITY_DN627_c0_g1_i1.p1 TRINITY_DN627_c0_g1~~TRINITY_DN627_c0_g1_i1.p1  ORF type:complete len:689 (+),score=212.42 TRINITY_DN627_c0_g1_i1:413-2479(+)
MSNDPPKKPIMLMGKGGQAYGGGLRVPPPRKAPSSSTPPDDSSSSTPNTASDSPTATTEPKTPNAASTPKDGTDLRKRALMMHKKIKQIMETPKPNLAEEDIGLLQIMSVTFKQIRECDIEGIVIIMVIELIKLTKSKCGSSSNKTQQSSTLDIKSGDLMEVDSDSLNDIGKSREKIDNDYYSREDDSYLTCFDVEIVQKVLIDIQSKLNTSSLPLSTPDSSSSSSSSTPSEDNENSEEQNSDSINKEHSNTNNNNNIAEQQSEKYILASDLETCVRSSYDYHSSSMDTSAHKNSNKTNSNISSSSSSKNSMNVSGSDLNNSASTNGNTTSTSTHKKMKYEVVGSRDKGVRMNNEDFYIVLEHLPQLFLHNQPLSCTLKSLSNSQASAPSSSSSSTGDNKSKNECPDLYIGLFDGHMGRQAAVYSIAQLHVNILRNPLFLQNHDLHSAIKSGFVKTDSYFNSWAKNHDIKAGTTAISIFLSANHLLIANCGDSKAILASRPSSTPSSTTTTATPSTPTTDASKPEEEAKKEEGNKEANKEEGMEESTSESKEATGVKVLSKTHHPDREDEKERVMKGGGKVVWYGTWRVNGLLAVSRSIGDRELSHLVIAEPELTEWEVEKEWEFVVVASDGLWDVMSPEDCVKWVRECVEEKGRKSVASYLISKAVGLKSKDNISVVVLFFDFENEN